MTRRESATIFVKLSSGQPLRKDFLHITRLYVIANLKSKIPDIL